MISRMECLNTALELVTGDREASSGDPKENFADIAELWTTYKGVAFEAHDVAAMQILLKIARVKTSPVKADHWVDIAGYAACGGEVSPATAQPKFSVSEQAVIDSLLHEGNR